MPKYGSYQREPTRDERESRRKIHPIWRGVGFAMMIIIPIMAYATTILLITQNQAKGWFPMPVDLAAGPGDFLYNGDPWLYLKIILTVSLALLFFAIFNLFTFVINSLFAPPRYGPYDVPPIKAKVRKRAR